MIAKPRFSKVLLLRVLVWLVVLALLILHFKLEIEMLGVLAGTGSLLFVLWFEIPRSMRKQKERANQQ
jgi:uncharacterized membrane protein